MIEWFDTRAIGKGASRIDFAKLEHLNGHYIRTSEDTELVELLRDNAQYLENGAHLASRFEKRAKQLAHQSHATVERKSQDVERSGQFQPVSVGAETAKTG